MDNVELMQGAFDNSENDFLIEKIGRKLYDKLCAVYNEFVQEDKIIEIIPPYESTPSAWIQLLTMCQRIIVFNAFYRSADVQSVSINNSGFNRMTADDYNTADDKSMDKFKASCNKEAHAAVNRLLTTLEIWEKELREKPDDKSLSDKKDIIELWKDSRFFYRVAGLVISTATTLNEYLDIYDNREKFINLVPDLKYIQEMVMTPEIGEQLMANFVTIANQGTDDSVLLRATVMLQRAMSLHLESRNKMFARQVQAHDEAVNATKMFTKIISDNIDHFVELFGEDAMESCPLYAGKKDHGECKNKTHRKGKVFITPYFS